MPRALSERWTQLSAGERAGFIARARARRDAVTTLGASYWVFERCDAEGAVVEFIEARDPTLLERARELVTEPGETVIRLSEVELD